MVDYRYSIFPMYQEHSCTLPSNNLLSIKTGWNLRETCGKLYVAVDTVKYFYIAVLHTLGFTGFWGAWVVWFYHLLIFTHQISGTTRIKFHQLSRVLHRSVEEPPISKSYMKVVCIFTLTSHQSWLWCSPLTLLLLVRHF